MGKKHYTNYSDKFNQSEENVEVLESETENLELVEESENVEEFEKPKDLIAKVCIDEKYTLNVRENPSKDSNPPITTLQNDSEVKVLEDLNNGWIKVVVPYGAEGYILKEFVIFE